MPKYVWYYKYHQINILQCGYFHYVLYYLTAIHHVCSFHVRCHTEQKILSFKKYVTATWIIKMASHTDEHK